MAATVAYGVSQTLVARTASMDDQVETVISHVDKLYDSNKMREAMEYLEKYSETTDPELLWRLARVCYKVMLASFCDFTFIFRISAKFSA